MQKKRLDHLLIERGLFETRARAQARIMAGDVFVDGERRDKAGQRFADEVTIEVKGSGLKYASRGGLKLEAALDAFGYGCEGKVVIDVGASTGGFTDCVLQRGAARVYAVDVGYGQLAWRLRTDDRVEVIERMNIRKMPRDHLPERCDLAVIDCSFISLHKVLKPTRAFLKEGADVVALIKPQFEVGKDRIGKGGVVRDAGFREEAIDDAIAEAEALGFERVDGIDCPVHGPKGNVEYLVWLRRARQEGAAEEE